MAYFGRGCTLIVLINYIYVYYAWIIWDEVTTMYIRDKNISHQNINMNSSLRLFTKVRSIALQMTFIPPHLIMYFISYIDFYYACTIRDEIIMKTISTKNISHQNINTNSGLGLFTKIRSNALWKMNNCLSFTFMSFFGGHILYF